MTPPGIRRLHDLYRAALAAADPKRVLAAHLPAPPRGRTVVVGMGKAAASMAAAVEAHWQGPLSGIVVVPQGATLELEHLEQIESAHPIPDARSVEAARRLMAAVAGLDSQDLVLALISGGGSALCALPAPGVTLEEKQAISEALLHRGATIREVNTVRKHLSAIKGGRLALRADPAPVVSLLISDVPGDDPALIASAPTLADPSSCADALAVIDHHRIAISPLVRAALIDGSLESPKPGARCFSTNSHRVIARAQDGLEAAALAARGVGLPAHILSDAMQGEARDLALAHAAIALQIKRHGQPFAAPCVILSGGEATVTVLGRGRGGRNTEFALALALALDGEAGIHALSAGTDGLDGSAAAAGAWISPDTLLRARALGVDPIARLRDNDSFGFFDAIGSTVVTGPTFTNINDFRAILVDCAA
ncbi:MAG: glycerate kinase [Gammaproteobacteria bacterium]|nr:glycerate kinase [Gammaproteobacteria bacterium]